MQTFEIFIPPNLLQQYKHRYLVDVETNIQKMNNENAATANYLIGDLISYQVGFYHQILSNNKIVLILLSKIS